MCERPRILSAGQMSRLSKSAVAIGSLRSSLRTLDRGLPMSESPFNSYETPSTMPRVVVVEDEQPAITEAPKKKPTGAPKWETETRERVKSSLRKFSKPLQDL